MTIRIDSEEDHRIVRLYQDLQTAAQRFWSTPPDLLDPQYHVMAETHSHFSASPHYRVVVAPSLEVDTPIYNLFVHGTAQHT